MMELHSNSICIVYILPQHSTLYASQVELTLFILYTPWSKVSSVSSINQYKFAVLEQ